ncbi:VanZ family protein [Tundrisphaera lichenicola]|uniref:VanZ family protein n=1 Tax=Tundrisphaera lichenicola TaxID=2029860 RepID=UPI003EB8E018
MLIAYMLFMLGLTLGGFYQVRAPRNLIPLKSMAFDLRAGGRHLVINFLGNIVAFLPIGFLIPKVVGQGRPFRTVFLLCFAFSLSIELLQGFSGRRVADVDDVILNTIGGLAGCWIGQGWSALMLRRASG